ncbi:hypothetical protein ACMX25_30810 [Caballeronia sp. 15715]|uniref:hypothetical protein n=1 Tax=Caballeronia sp. 15715 TaxID=3391030 RepID=UPI0039E39EB2
MDLDLIKPGEKLPSLQPLAAKTVFSVVTQYQAYEVLESQGICGTDRTFTPKVPQKVLKLRSHPMPVKSPDDLFASRAPINATAPAIMFSACGDTEEDAFLGADSLADCA